MHRFTAHLFHFLLAAALLPAASMAAPADLYDSLAAQPSGEIHFLSVTPKSRYELAHRGYDVKGTEVWGQLDLPKDGRGPFPAMVIAHGSAGVQRKDLERWVPLFNQMGIATLLVDSFKPRGIKRTDEDQSQLDQAANDADALSALKLLATDPRIDASRIGVIGFSRGGIVALDTSVDTWRTPSPLTGAPIMMAPSGKDDYTPARPCVAFG
jgi:dienelactone hydrolase